jgi:hypothetical protein
VIAESKLPVQEMTTNETERLSGGNFFGLVVRTGIERQVPKTLFPNDSKTAIGSGGIDAQRVNVFEWQVEILSCVWPCAKADEQERNDVNASQWFARPQLIGGRAFGKVGENRRQ